VRFQLIPTKVYGNSAINWTSVDRTKLTLLATVDGQSVILSSHQSAAREAARRAGLSATAEWADTCFHAGDDATSIPSQCCAVPYTLNGGLYHNCTIDEAVGSHFGCPHTNGQWVNCQQPAGTSSLLSVDAIGRWFLTSLYAPHRRCKSCYLGLLKGAVNWSTGLHGTGSNLDGLYTKNVMNPCLKEIAANSVCQHTWTISMSFPQSLFCC